MAYTSLDAVKLELGSGYSSDDSLLAAYIAQAQKHIDTLLGFPMEAAADTTRYFNPLVHVTGRQLWLDYPLAAITSITNNGTLVTAAQYVAEPVNELPYRSISLLISTSLYWTYNTDPEKAIVIVGKWAWAATVPADIQRVATRMVAYWYRLKDSQVFDVTANPETGQLVIPKGMPVDVKPIIDGYRRKWRTR